MDVISHNAEIPQMETEPPLRLSGESEKQHFEPRLKQAHVVMVYFRRDMVCGSVMEYAQTSHTYNKGLARKLPELFKLFYQEVSDTKFFP
jgi:hypothetical protein